jgi:hypothetical protein
MAGFEAVRPGSLDNIRPRPARNWGIAMKLLAVLIAATVLGAIIVNRDDIMRYVKMRQM